MGLQEVYEADQIEALKRFGRMLRDKRREAGYKHGTTFAEKVGEISRVSSQYLSQIETGYINPKRGPVVPSSKLLDAISAVLGWPRSEIDRELSSVYDKEVQERLGDFLTKMLSTLDQDQVEEFVGLVRQAWNRTH